MSTGSSETDAAIAVLRLGLGARPGELRSVAADPRSWLHAQITPAGAEQPGGSLPASVDALASLDGRVSPAKDAHAAVLAQAEAFARSGLGIATLTGFRERWALFWVNHFSVTSDGPEVAAIAGAFEREAIRPNVFGQFDALALAALKHPALLMAFEQTQSAGPQSPAVLAHGGGMSENLGRESLELHTVGADAGYTQADVVEMSLALTGWSVAGAAEPWAGQFVFRPEAHQPGPRTILGQTFGGSPDTQADGIITALARRPETAHHLAAKVARHFVSDMPPPALVDRLAQSYVATDGSLAAMAHALVDAPETWDPSAAKFKSPYDLYVSANRALDRQPAGLEEPAAVCAELDQPFHGAPTPLGWSDHEAAWASPSGMAKRLAWLRGLQMANASDAAFHAVARDALGPRLRRQTLSVAANSAWGDDRLALLFISPEFQRR